MHFPEGLENIPFNLCFDLIINIVPNSQNKSQVMLWSLIL